MNDMAPTRFGMGAAVRRKEDNAFLTGKGKYTDDFTALGMLHGYVLRSPYAHATFTIGDLTAAAAHPGVHLVMTAADVAHLKPMPCTARVRQPDGTMNTNRDIPLLCDGIVRHVGDAIAFIIADTVQIARDASELIELDFDALDVVTGTEEALEAGAPLVYPDSGTNVAFLTRTGDYEATDKAFASAHHVTTLKIVNNRLVSNFMETRSCLAEWIENEDRWSMVVCSQGVYGIRNMMMNIFGIGEDKIRVRTADVGGGFGTKVFSYREYPLCMEAAKRVGRPVKWTGDRTEHFTADAQGRDNVAHASMAMDENGRFLAIRVNLLAAMGAYLHAYGPYIPTLGISMTTGVYDIPCMACDLRGVYTNTVPVDAYRGAGRPEAAYLIERLVDQCAIDMNIPREEIRRRNFIRPDQMPYTTPGKRMYDVGDFDGHMTLAMERADWAGFDSRNDEAMKRGRFRGIGLATYIEACAFAGSEPAFIELTQSGDFVLKIGTQSNGQGHATAYAQLAADKLGIDYEKIHLHQGDTDELSKGMGTGGSRSVPLGGVSVVRASEDLAEKIRNIAAGRLEAAAADIELVEGKAKIVGTDRFMTFAEIAAAAATPDDRKGQGEWKQAEATYPNGTHVCEVEIDPLTGTSEVVRYTIVDDFGVTVNPILLAGQVHGGVVQGIGQALHERTVYDEDGQLLTASFMDYRMPRAADFPDIHFETRNIPSITNALGIKGAGEAGSIGSTPAVMNAVCHAFYRQYGIQSLDMPVTPNLVWEIVNEAAQG
ncbi:MAG: xanthine dehydrogenase family protein molybdopterin-binding subunit [Rhizobiaceae bacterium]